MENKAAYSVRSYEEYSATQLNFTQCKDSSQQTSVNLKQSRISTPFKHFGIHQDSYQDCDMQDMICPPPFIKWC